VIEAPMVPLSVQVEGGAKTLTLLLVNSPISLDESKIFSGCSCEDLKIIALLSGVRVGVIAYVREI